MSSVAPIMENRLEAGALHAGRVRIWTVAANQGKVNTMIEKRQQDDAFPTIAILPWCKLKDQFTMCNIDFIPWRIESGTVHSIFLSQEKLKKVMSSYVDDQGLPVSQATIAMHKSAEPDGSISVEQINDIRTATQLMAFATIAENSYFRLFGQCANSSSFRVVYQRISDDDGIAISIGRRCTGGLLDGGYKHGEIRFSSPVQCKYVGDISPNKEFVKALSLMQLRKNALDIRLTRAIRLFTVAYTDDAFFPCEQEIIILMMAYEGCFEECVGRIELASKISNLLYEYSSVTIEGSDRDIDLDDLDKGISPSMPLNKAWASECYKLRNDHVHGNPPRPMTWSENEHLVFASWLFPFLVKLLLSTMGAYELQKPDTESLTAVDMLLDTEDWGSRAKDDNRSNWQVTEVRAVQQVLVRKLQKYAVKHEILDDDPKG